MISATAQPNKKTQRARERSNALPLQMAADATTKRSNAEVAPAESEASAIRDSCHSPAIVVEAALATQDDLGPWLAAHWGLLADIDPKHLTDIDL